MEYELENKIYERMCSNKSMWSSLRGFEVETMFLLWKEFLTYFPFLLASHSLFFSNLSFGIPITKSFRTRWLRWCMLMCTTLRCHNQETFIHVEVRRLFLKLEISSMHKTLCFNRLSSYWQSITQVIWTLQRDPHLV